MLLSALMVISAGPGLQPVLFLQAATSVQPYQRGVQPYSVFKRREASSQGHLELELLFNSSVL